MKRERAEEKRLDERQTTNCTYYEERQRQRQREKNEYLKPERP